MSKTTTNTVQSNAAIFENSNGIWSDPFTDHDFKINNQYTEFPVAKKLTIKQLKKVAENILIHGFMPIYDIYSSYCISRILKIVCFI